ncbi:blastopia polyprotein [Trichonephila clavipes]|nr:blastopia polyprotein [Trichonephila clavipes]
MQARRLKPTETLQEYFLTMRDLAHKALCDTGSQATINNEKTYEKLGYPTLNPSQCTFSGIGRDRVESKDKGSAFTSTEFQNFCQDETTEYIQITTGVPRGNGQIECMHEAIIPVLTKLTIEEPEKWFKHVHRLLRIMNSTTTRRTKFTPFEVLIGKQCNKHRKPIYNYKPRGTVAIQRTQFGTGLKLRPKYFGPYEVTKVNKRDRYEVQKIGQHEGPNVTSTSADKMKKW